MIYLHNSFFSLRHQNDQDRSRIAREMYHLQMVSNLFSTYLIFSRFSEMLGLVCVWQMDLQVIPKNCQLFWQGIKKLCLQKTEHPEIQC